MRENSPFEGALDGLGGEVALGQIVSIDSLNRTVRVKTLGNAQRGTDDQDLQNVKILHFTWHPDGTYGVSMPMLGSYHIVGYINSEPVLLGAYPLSNTEGGDQRDNIEPLLPGDFAFVTASGSKLIVRSGGTVEIEATKNTRTYWLPTHETITTVCENNEMDAAAGFEYWKLDDETQDTVVTRKVYDNLSVGTVVQTQVGTTDSGGVFDLQIGDPNDELGIDEPNLQVTVQADGTTTVNVKAGKVTITITPDGKLDVTTTADATFTVGGKTDFEVTGDAIINAGGKVDITAGGDANVTASGNINAMGAKIILNGSGSGVTTANSHMNVIDLITGAPVQPSMTVFADV